MKKRITAIILSAVMTAMSASAASVELFLSEKAVNAEKDGVVTAISAADYKEEGGVSYIAPETMESLFGIKADGNKFTYGEKVTEATVENGMVPLKKTLEALGFLVKYSPVLDSVLVSDKAAVISVNDEKVPYEAYKLFYDLNIEDITQAVEAGVDFGTDDIDGIVKESVTSMLSEITAVNAEAKSSGFDKFLQMENTKQQIKEQVSYLKAEGLAEFSAALDTTIAGVLELQTIASTYSQIANGTIKVEKEEALDFYKENYITAKHILISTEDMETGAPLDEKGLAEASMLAEKIKEQLKKGEDFDKLMNEYTEDPGTENYPDGYTFTKGEMVEPFEKAAFALKEGEVSEIVKSDFGYHIIKREPLAALDATTETIITNALKNEKHSKYITGIVEKYEVAVDEEAINAMK